jgi:hypothetical protein
MRGIILASLLVAGLIGAGISPAAAQSAGTESAAQNVRESQIYDQLVCSNPGFREQRMRIECGPIADPQLRQNCLATFNCGPGAPSGRNFRGDPTSEQVR